MSGCPFHNSTAATPSIMEALKSSTSARHDAAEGHQFQKSLVKGELPREQYAAYLGQLLHVHRTLESLLRNHASSTPAIAAVVKSVQYQEPYLLEDLAFYGLDPARIEPLPATKALAEEMQRVARECPAALLGYHYVMEGSNNGNKFIARALAQAYRLPAGKGLKYLDPYGDQQRPFWMQFKTDMDAQSFTADERQRMLAAADSMFAAIGAISTELAVPVAA